MDESGEPARVFSPLFSMIFSSSRCNFVLIDPFNMTGRQRFAGRLFFWDLPGCPQPTVSSSRTKIQAACDRMESVLPTVLPGLAQFSLFQPDRRACALG
jgi:hypothetical protein